MNQRHTDFHSVADRAQAQLSAKLTDNGETDGARGGARPAQNQPPERTTSDPDLALLIGHWQGLPEHIKAAVLSLVRVTV